MTTCLSALALYHLVENLILARSHAQWSSYSSICFHNIPLNKLALISSLMLKLQISKVSKLQEPKEHWSWAFFTMRTQSSLVSYSFYWWAWWWWNVPSLLCICLDKGSCHCLWKIFAVAWTCFEGKRWPAAQLVSIYKWSNGCFHLARKARWLLLKKGY